ncbi:MAG: hypothetical protein ABSD80_12665 [Caulobacteraceae bacterium]
MALALRPSRDYERRRMDRWFRGALLGGVAVFALGVAGAIGYQAIYIWPQQNCDKAGLWWDEQDRQCLTPVPIRRYLHSVFETYKVTPASPPAPTARPPAPAH